MNLRGWNWKENLVESLTTKLSFGAKRSKLERLVGRSVTQGETE
jgi:hypothetical protein